MNVKPTAEVIQEMARTLRRYADEMDRIAEKMIANNDIERASEAMSALVNCYANMRPDLLVTRPIREFMKDKANV